MNSRARIDWWLEQVEATRRSVVAGREHRRRPAEVHARTISGDWDEELDRSLPEPPAGRGVRPAVPAGTSSPPRPIGGGAGVGAAGGSSALGRAKMLAAGYQPAVIKVVSYARGAARATATGQYLQREDVALETHDGRMLTNREAVADEIGLWATHFSKRAESQDVGAFRVTLAGVEDTPQGRATYEGAIAAGFAGHRHAWRLETTASGALEARVVAAMAGTAKERLRVREERIGDGEAATARKRLDRASEGRLVERLAAGAQLPPQAISIGVRGTSHGRDGVTFRLNKLIDRGPARDDRGKALANAADARIAARGEWGPTLRSQSSRDTMHLIISAKAGTDVEALTRAARAFLHDRFADHRFMFGVHTDKEAAGHIHAHAVIAVKSESGQKIHPGRETFRDWRQAYAEHARAEGLRIVATSARERASSQSYGPRDKAIVEAADRPRPAREARDRAYAADPANRRLIETARQRIAVARANPIRLPLSAPARHAVNEGVLAWKAVAAQQPANPVAKDMLARLLMAQTVAAIVETIGRRVTYLSRETTDMAVTSEQMAKDLRQMNEAVSKTSDMLDGATKQQFREASSRYLETLANRLDLQRAQESGVRQMTRADVEAIVGGNADRIIERADALQRKEQAEAASAGRLADRAIEAERRQEAVAGLDATSQHELRAERAIVADARKSAAQESREAVAATEAALSLATNPAQPLSRALAETDALARLRAEQEQIVRDIEANEGERSESQKPQRMR